jgi:hypothetical protein
MGQTGFQHTDAWIFVSMAFYQGDIGTSLRDLIAMADYINHTAPTAGEIEGAIYRLSRAGLVTVRDDLFYLTSSGRRLLTKIRAKRPSLLQTWKQVEECLDSSEFPQLTIPSFQLDPENFQRAYISYLASTVIIKPRLKRTLFD